jgi:uncharacterized RDD family membrane protein YckC
MKCPKCGYLGFETSDRCRNCGYDFSLSVVVEPSAELPLQPRDSAAGPLADLSLGEPAEPLARPSAGLDLDRLIGVSAEPEAAVVSRPASAPRSTPPVERLRSEPALASAASSAPEIVQTPAAESGEAAKGELPLFAPTGHDVDDVPLITAPRPVRPPLSVRRATPDVPRGRSRTRVTPRRDDPSLELDPVSGDPVAVDASAAQPRLATDLRSAGVLARATALLVDTVLLGAIDAGVLYFTLAIAGLQVNEVRTLPLIPLIAFLLILDGGYLIAFTTAGGQTIGKMLTGIRVMGDDGHRVDTAGAVLRAVGCLATVISLGIGYLPVFFSADGRALHDRIAGTRVVESDET